MAEKVKKEVKTVDTVMVTIIRYALELVTKQTMDKIEEAGENEDYVNLMKSAKKGQITDEQMENAVLFYSLRPDEMKEDMERIFETVRGMVNSSLEGVS